MDVFTMQTSTMRKDLVGQIFDKLTVISYSHHEQVISCGKPMWRYFWNCKCECGNTVKVWTSHLTREKKKSCGCFHKPNLIGRRFIKGVVIDEVPIDQRRQRNRQEWLLQCDCGNKYQATTVMLTGKVSRRVTSCGCRSKLSGRFSHKFGHTKYKTGDKIHPTHWNRIMIRAKKKGIHIDLTPDEAYSIFVEQNGKCKLSGVDISLGSREKYNPKEITASLDRIDSDGYYTKDNVQWVYKEINFMKYTLSQEQFIYLCKMVAANNR